MISKYLKYLSVGILFGIVMTKSEAVSWYRMQEMFRFESFHMYGIIGTAVVVGMLVVYLIKRVQLKNVDGDQIKFNPKSMSITRYLAGGIIFGFGWSLVGACPGPMFTLIGHGAWAILLVIASSILGTYVYGLVRHKLPH
jgi:uncharacterized membrane protein YedE/YeeE